MHNEQARDELEHNCDKLGRRDELLGNDDQVLGLDLLLQEFNGTSHICDAVHSLMVYSMGYTYTARNRLSTYPNTNPMTYTKDGFQRELNHDVHNVDMLPQFHDLARTWNYLFKRYMHKQLVDQMFLRMVGVDSLLVLRMVRFTFILKYL